MTVLITGGAGYIGSHTVVSLIESGYECIILDNFSTSNIKQIKGIEEIVNRQITYYNIDLLDYEKVKEVFIKHQFHSVIHFASKKSVIESIHDPLLYYSENVIGTLNLIRVMKEMNVKSLIFSSTANIYGKNKSPLKENFPLKSNNPYGKTKLINEEVFRDLAFSDKEWSIVSLRYFNPIGYHPTALIGETINQYSTNLMPSLLRVANRELPSLKIYGGDYNSIDGTAIRDFLHVMDLAKGHVNALNYVETFSGAIEINLGSGIGRTVKELVDTFSIVNSIAIPIDIIERREGDIAVSYADVQKAKKLLNWRTSYTLEDMCVHSWRWYKKNFFQL